MADIRANRFSPEPRRHTWHKRAVNFLSNFLLVPDDEMSLLIVAGFVVAIVLIAVLGAAVEARPDPPSNFLG